jgi:hypothetical protein
MLLCIQGYCNKEVRHNQVKTKANGRVKSKRTQPSILWVIRRTVATVHGVSP